MIKNKKILLALFLIFGFISFMFIFAEPAYALPSVKDGANLIKPIGTMITACFNSLCILSAGFTITQIVISRDQKTVNGAYKFLYTIIATFFIFNLLGTIFTYAGNYIPKNSYNYKTGTYGTVNSGTSSKVNQKEDKNNYGSTADAGAFKKDSKSSQTTTKNSKK